VAERKLAPDALLVDYHLDDGNGIEAIAELRRRGGADLAGILITADRGLNVREEARAARGLPWLDRFRLLSQNRCLIHSNGSVGRCADGSRSDSTQEADGAFAA
jgi:CheY-like chemotaxis protein